MNDDDFIPNAILVEVSIDEEGRLMFSGGWNFDEDYPEDSAEFLQDILAGMYALVNTQTDNVVAAGKILRAAPGFEGFVPQDDQMEFVFEPDEEFVNRVKGKDQPDLNVIKFDPKKHRKH